MRSGTRTWEAFYDAKKIQFEPGVKFLLMYFCLPDTGGLERTTKIDKIIKNRSIDLFK